MCDFTDEDILAIEDIDEFVNGLMSYEVLVMENSQPDIQVLQIDHSFSVDMLIQEHVGDTPFQTIVCNKDPETNQICPYFRVIMKDFGAPSTINFKLKTFFGKINIPELSARCAKALVLGLHALHMLNSPVTVPNCFTVTPVDPIEYVVPGDEIDVACLQPMAQGIARGETLCQIAGILLPYFVPVEVQNCILSYCRSPTADLIDAAVDMVLTNWDNALSPMYFQREPRVPPNIALRYRATNAQLSIGAATRFILAPVALRGV